MITLEQAIGQRRAFSHAAQMSTVPQVKVMLHRAWLEWRQAILTVKELEEGAYVIALFTEIVPGMIVADERGDCSVVRKLENGGQTSLHLESRISSTPIYQNYQGQTSPVVVLDVPMMPPPAINEMTDPADDDMAPTGGANLSDNDMIGED